MIKAVTVADIFNEVKFEGDERFMTHYRGHKFTIEGLKHSWGTLKESLHRGNFMHAHYVHRCDAGTSNTDTASYLMTLKSPKKNTVLV